MGKKILVIEDNPDNMKLVTWILEDEGYEVDTANTAETGIKRIESNHYDMILMDISLPGMDGKDATRYLRSQEKFKDLPIIALTAHAIKGEDEAILDSGVTDLITKPLDEVYLLKRIKEILS